MSDNRGHDWLDDATAERLLRGAHGGGDARETWRDERAAALAGLLAAAATPAPVDPEREEAAVAAFRTARDADALSDGAAGARGAGAGGRSSGAGPGTLFHIGGRRPRRRSGSLTGTLIATAAVAGVSLAAGALPVLLGDSVPNPAPVQTQGAATAASDTGSASPGPPAPVTSRPGHDRDRPAGGATPRGVVATPGRSAGTPSSTAAVDLKELCRAYAAAGRHRKNMDEHAYKQLRTAAGGGRRQVRRYCSALLDWNPGRGGEGGKIKRDEAGEDDSRDRRGRWDDRFGGQRRHGGHGSRADSGPGPAAPSGGRPRSGPHSDRGDG